MNRHAGFLTINGVDKLSAIGKNCSVAADVADAALQRPGHDACAGGAARCSLDAGLCLFYTCQFLFPADNPVY